MITIEVLIDNNFYFNQMNRFRYYTIDYKTAYEIAKEAQA